MRASILAGLLAAGSAHAFSDSSPFLLFSTAELPVDSSTSQLQTSARVVSTAKAILAGCPTTNYLLVSQPNVHATDLYSPPSCEAHRLHRALTGSSVRGRFSVSEVVSGSSRGGSNNMTLDDFSSHIKTSCAAKEVDAAVKELALPALPQAQSCKDRAEAMGDNDYVLGNVLDDELPRGDYTVVYFSGADAAHGKYEAAFDDPAQVPIKKRIAEHVPLLPRQTAPAEKDNRPLFEKYQFFTPGVFMGLIVFFLLLSILYVGLSAVASLQVPYGAFDKEMGPSAQKKQQ